MRCCVGAWCTSMRDSWVQVEVAVAAASAKAVAWRALRNMLRERGAAVPVYLRHGVGPAPCHKL